MQLPEYKLEPPEMFEDMAEAVPSYARRRVIDMSIL